MILSPIEPHHWGRLTGKRSGRLVSTTTSIRCVSYERASDGKAVEYWVVGSPPGPALRTTQTKAVRFLSSRFVRARAFTPKQKTPERHKNTHTMIGLYMWSYADKHTIIFDTSSSLAVGHGSGKACIFFLNFTLRPKLRPPSGSHLNVVLIHPQQIFRSRKNVTDFPQLVWIVPTLLMFQRLAGPKTPWFPCYICALTATRTVEQDWTYPRTKQSHIDPLIGYPAGKHDFWTHISMPLW